MRGRRGQLSAANSTSPLAHLQSVHCLLPSEELLVPLLQDIELEAAVVHAKANRRDRRRRVDKKGPSPTAWSRRSSYGKIFEVRRLLSVCNNVGMALL